MKLLLNELIFRSITQQIRKYLKNNNKTSFIIILYLFLILQTSSIMKFIMQGKHNRYTKY